MLNASEVVLSVNSLDFFIVYRDLYVIHTPDGFFLLLLYFRFFVAENSVVAGCYDVSVREISRPPS